jgi:hypothetical protein
MAGDTLYVFNSRNELLWKWSTDGPPLTDMPVEDSTGTMYAIGFDLTWVALNSATGETKWQGTASGGAVYSQIELYKGDKYLVVTDMESYREKFDDNTIEDTLSLCRGNSILWTTQIPAGARIRIQGGRVYWLVRRQGRILRRQIPIPVDTPKPIGKVSVLADYN